MKTVLAAAVSAGLVVASLTAPPAQADASGYLRCVHGGLGGYVDDNTALGIGQDVIKLERANQPREAIINRLYGNGSMGFSLTETQTIVGCAEHFLS
jgi:hypothetical protein